MPIADGVMTITPDDIQITRHLFDAFGHYETEISAQWLVRFAQARGWRPFTYDDIEKFYSKGGKLSGFGFNKLVGRFIMHLPVLKDGIAVPCKTDEDGIYHFTEEFISRCYKSATRP
jgi:hypothetical protein